MKKSVIAAFALCCIVSNVKAQSYKETFDSNSLEWTECAFKNANGSAIIDKGVMTVKSKGENKGLSALASVATGVATKVGTNTFFETHCYAPIDVMKPFKIRTKVNIDKLGVENIVGLVFNYKDGGNFYCFSFNDESVSFIRYVDGQTVGAIQQGVKWSDNRKVDQEWELESDGNTLTFLVNGAPIMKVRHMPLEYSGVGYYTFGKQTLVADEIEFIQL